MANLVENLQSIYSTKQQIKDVLNTQSDVFSDYPDLIRQRIEESGSGESGGAVLSTQYIDRNGDYYAPDFGSDGFERVIVAVPTEGGEGGYTPAGNEDEPFSCTYAATVIKDSLEDGQSYGYGCVTGIVSQVFTTWNAGFSRCRFDITDDGRQRNYNATVRCYNVGFTANWGQFDMYKVPNIGIGDFVTVAGNMSRYYDAGIDQHMIQFDAGGTVIKHTKVNESVTTVTSNGQYIVSDSCSVIVDVPQEGGGEVIDNGFKFPDNNNYNQPWTCLYAKKMSDEKLMDGMYWEDLGNFGFVSVGGIVTEVQYTFSEQYPSARFTIADGQGYDLSNGAVKCFAVFCSKEAAGAGGGSYWSPDLYEQIEPGDYVIVSTRFTKYFDAGLGYSYPECYGGYIYRHFKPGKNPKWEVD